AYRGGGVPGREGRGAARRARVRAGPGGCGRGRRSRLHSRQGRPEERRAVSAQPDTLPRYRRMVAGDLDAIMAIEESIYPHPWTRGNFSDSLTAGYHCWIVERRGEVAGYAVVAMAAEGADLLNRGISGRL